MRKMNISVAKSYTDKNTNAVKTKWINIGSLVIGDDGKVFGEIESIPVGVTELKFNCFDRDESRSNNFANSNSSNHQQPQQTYNAPHGQIPVYNEPAPGQQYQQR
jgi:hypothetical protein